MLAVALAPGGGAAASGVSPAATAGGPPAVVPLRFGLTADYPPFALRDASGALTGADVEAARRVARALGRDALFVPTRWDTLAQDLATGRFDAVIGGLTVTPERAAVGRYSVELMRDGKRPLVRCADRERLATPAQLDRPQVRVMINRGPSMPAVAQRLFPRATLVRNPDDATLVTFLLAGRVDAWVTDGVVVDHMARRHRDVLCAARSGPWAGTEVRKAWLLRSDPVLADAMDDALREELASGRWRADLEAVP
jgi:cyclohexadienyl dehydratase